MDPEALVQRATTDLSRARRLEATLEIVRSFPPRKATALVLRVFEAHAHAPWRTELLAEAEPLVQALEAERTEHSTRVLRGLLGQITGVARAMADALIRRNDTGAMAHLIELTKQGLDDEALAAAAYALAGLGDSTAVMALKDLADRASADVAEEARRAVAAIQARVGEAARGALSSAAGGELSSPSEEE